MSPTQKAVFAVVRNHLLDKVLVTEQDRNSFLALLSICQSDKDAAVAKEFNRALEFVRQIREATEREIDQVSGQLSKQAHTIAKQERDLHDANTQALLFKQKSEALAEEVKRLDDIVRRQSLEMAPQLWGVIAVVAESEYDTDHLRKPKTARFYPIMLRDFEEMQDEWKKGNKIQAIKILRRASLCGLIEAKLSLEFAICSDIRPARFHNPKSGYLFFCGDCQTWHEKDAHVYANPIGGPSIHLGKCEAAYLPIDRTWCEACKSYHRSDHPHRYPFIRDGFSSGLEAGVPWCDQCKCYHRPEAPHVGGDKLDHLMVANDRPATDLTVESTPRRRSTRASFRDSQKMTSHKNESEELFQKRGVVLDRILSNLGTVSGHQIEWHGEWKHDGAVNLYYLETKVQPAFEGSPLVDKQLNVVFFDDSDSLNYVHFGGESLNINMFLPEPPKRDPNPNNLSGYQDGL